MLVLSLGVKWGAGCLALMEKLESFKKQAQEAHAGVGVFFGKRLFLMRPSGKSSGGGRGTHYAFVMDTGGYTVKVSSQEEPSQGTPNVIMEAGSFELMTCGGVHGAWERVKEIVTDLGGVIVFDKVSRVDLCVDLPGVDVGSFYGLVDGEQYACRARRQDFHKDGTRKTGVTLGAGGDIVCRIYDKAYEVSQAHPDPDKERVLEQRRWAGPQDRATRVEFQLRRTPLKEFGVESVADYLRLRGDICAYLTTKWLRLLAEKPDRQNNNTQRTAPHEIWLDVIRAFATWVGSTAVAACRIPRSVYGDPVRLLKQGDGCFRAAIADLKSGALISASEYKDAVTKCVDFLLGQFGDLGFHQRYAAKAARVAALAPA